MKRSEKKQFWRKRKLSKKRNKISRMKMFQCPKIPNNQKIMITIYKKL